MVKRLIDKLRRGLRRGTAIATLGLSLYACNPLVTPIPTTNSRPQSTVYVSPTSGEAPLESNLQVDGEDPDGKSDITEYKLEIDKNADGDIDEIIVQQTPIDVTRTFDDDAIIYGQVKDLEGEIDKKNVRINVSPEPDYVNISGKLEDCEEDTGRAGVIKIYNATDNSFLDSCTANSNGDFSITLDELVTELDGVVLQARIMDESTPKSYVRTIELPQGDHENVLVRAVPYDNPNDNYDDELDIANRKGDFKEHMDRVNFSDEVVSMNPAPEPGRHYLKKWNYEDFPEITEHFEGIEISAIDFPDDYETIKNAIKTSGYVKPNGMPLNDSDFVHGDTHSNETGWGRIVHGSYPPYTEVWDYNQNGYIERFTSYLNTPNADVVNHEVAGHGLIFPGHASEEGGPEKLFDSIMVWTGATSPFKPVDIKGNYIVNEETYKGKENIDDILGTEFYE